MAPVVQVKAKQSQGTPRILVVDDESTLVELMRDAVQPHVRCRILSAGSVKEACEIVARQEIDLLVTDVHLPDGSGLQLILALKEARPHASAVVVTGDRSIDGAIDAIRSGAVDFLTKPFGANELLERMKAALDAQALNAKREQRIDKLRDAVKRLNDARRTVGKKVDLLCNDLVSAYTDLSNQFDQVRTQNSFRELLLGSRDLEQMLCHAMDWMLRQFGYCNVAVWLASDDDQFQLGAYMKYTIAGEPALVDAMKKNLVAQVVRTGVMHLTSEQVNHQCTPEELDYLADQTVLGANCTYLGEAIAAVVLFRDAKTPFKPEDEAVLKSVAPILATALAGIVKQSQVPNDDELDEYDGPEDTLPDATDDNPSKKKKREDRDGDWWKRGEAPPF